MEGSGVVFGLVVGVLVGWVGAPSEDDAVARCLRECGDGSGTDAETCRLQCRQRAAQGEAPIKHWKRVELKGGSPDPNVEGGSTTTTVERGAHGTTTTTTKTDRDGKTTVRRVPGPEAPPRKGTPFSLPLRLQAWCYLGCSTRGTVGQRARCRTSCPRPGGVDGRGSQVQTTGVQRQHDRASTPDPAACRAACATTGQRCRDACPSRPADRATCALQCDQSEATCRKRC